MGNFQAKRKNMECKKERDVETLRAKVRLQRKDMKEIISTREIESRTYEQELMAFALKEAEWNRERQRLLDKVKKLQVKEGNLQGFVEHEEFVGDKDGNDWKMLGNSYVMEWIREEGLRRDEAVDKWKRLYLTIKTELDHLIKMTHQEERMGWRVEETNLMSELHAELQVKEDTIEQLREQLASKEKENWRLEREVDILKQSLRIMTHSKGKKMSQVSEEAAGKTI
ncbi:NADP-dependent alkenal double bond reductase P1-like [Heracleum sosnowskyi]|uniref:NADP-dependent alkenal double bond reductase P1-like n=1 Tax=Heracleum sosnowskyi TaxID=360622 RepID=A0AAD8I602_9APIA|nr:NADP-dependent alkenal double bond reductase P1-like [Heracleum sosnowskyi]